MDGAPANLFGAGYTPSSLSVGPVPPEPQQCSCCTMPA